MNNSGEMKFHKDGTGKPLMVLLLKRTVHLAHSLLEAVERKDMGHKEAEGCFKVIETALSEKFPETKAAIDTLKTLFMDDLKRLGEENEKPSTTKI